MRKVKNIIRQNKKGALQEFLFGAQESIASTEAIGLSMPPTPVIRVDKPSYDYGSKIKVAPTVSPKLDKITFIKYRELPVCIYMMDERFLKTSETIKFN